MRIETSAFAGRRHVEFPGMGRDLAVSSRRPKQAGTADELLLLNVATALAVALVCCAWIAIALD